MDLQSLLSGFTQNKGGSDFLSSALQLIGGNNGGLNGLMQMFATKGLSDVIQSWVGTGSNLPISAEQIRSVFGDDKVSEIAKLTGSDSEKTSSDLSSFLPEFIDKITPEGKIPAGGFEGLNLNKLGELFK